MTTPGKTVVLPTGKRGVLSSGRAAVFNADGQCPRCCCEPLVLASATTNFSNRVFDLTPYQGENMAAAGAYWRLIEVGACFPDNYPWYGAGCVDANGVLTGLPANFTSEFEYDGFLELQIGCLSPDDTEIFWPGTCQNRTGVYEC